MNDVSVKAKNLQGSEIIKLAGEINQKIKAGEQIYNLTIGDFNPQIFPIPALLKSYIIDAYENGETNYPPADGIQELKTAVLGFIRQYEQLEFANDEIMIAGGGRPLIYAIYQTLIDDGDKVLYPVPSWNNNHYCHLSDAQKIEIVTSPEHAFMPTAAELAPYIGEASMLALCSPLNPTGTTFSEEALRGICELVLKENEKRQAEKRKPLYVLYDQMYWMLTSEGIVHHNPVSLFPDMKRYTIFVDGISKSLSATGVRVGWSMGPANVIARMKSILGHIGAWAPKAEQVATARFLSNDAAVKEYLGVLLQKINFRFKEIYTGFETLKAKGYPVQVIAPEGAIYLTAQFALKGKVSAEGHTIRTTEDITAYLLNEAKLAVVPFTAFGCETGTDWYRISIGTLKESDIPEMLAKLDAALAKLK
jgi:aspartate aminotransferase